jgi:hypothetical protein
MSGYKSRLLRARSERAAPGRFACLSRAPPDRFRPSLSLYFSNCCPGGVCGESNLKFEEKLKLQILFQLPQPFSV